MEALSFTGSNDVGSREVGTKNRPQNWKNGSTPNAWEKMHDDGGLSVEEQNATMSRRTKAPKTSG